jgi:malic enzyme
MGMAVFATEATRVTEEMFIVTAKAVAEQVTEESLAKGLIYPPQSRIFEGIVTFAKYRRFSSRFGSAMRALRR